MRHPRNQGTRGLEMGSAKVWGRLVLGLLATSVFSGSAWSQSTVTPDQEYQKLIKVNEDIAPLGANPFGENISTYDGALSFDQTDVSLTGNGPALVIARSLSTSNPLPFSLNAERPFGDWDLNIPRIETATVAQGTTAGWITGGNPTPGTRCSYFSGPPDTPATQGGNSWSSDQWWYGYHLIVPGAGSQELLGRSASNSLAPAAGAATYEIVTKQNWMITCTASNGADDGGQGFIALAPDGTQYTFTHLVYRPMSTITTPLGTAPAAMSATTNTTGIGGVRPLVASSNILYRNDAFMYVTKVVDRFGNSLTYSYNNANGNLTGITASDGRSVTVNYDSTGYLITSITANASNVASRTWTYTYDTTTNSQLPTLTGVALPDGSAWSYNLAVFQTDASAPSVGDCTTNPIPTSFNPAPGPAVTGTITHPSGLTGTFALAYVAHGRSYVPKTCWGSNTSSDLPYYEIPEAYYQPTITSKSFSGAGVPTETWTYNYSSPNPSARSDACYASGTCASIVYTDVVDPNGNDVRYTYSNRFDATEGQLLSTAYYTGAAGGTVLRTDTNTYANPTGGSWPSPVGNDPQGRHNTLQTTELAPLQQRQTTEEGDTYTWQALAYDAYAHPTDVKRYNSISGQTSIEETTTFFNDPNLWVLGLTQTVVNNTTGETELSNTYNSLDLLQSRSHFGEFMMSYTYNSAGQLASFTDGNTQTTSLSNYYRGIPQSISYPDNTSESLSVDDLGQITSITDQAGNTTQYSYDPIGRIKQVTYPSNDTVAWYPKLFTYSFVNSAERGIAAGHWDRTTTVGNAVTTTYFDADLRPVLSDVSISGTASSDITTATSYDWTGKTTFASYPVSGSPALSGVTTGTHHTYDALERETQTQEDSELGLLTTTTAYIGGAGLQVTDPKNNVTTTYHQVFDEPAYKDPIQVNAPAGISQSIARDIYGNPTSITQSGAYGTENDSVTKTLVYDSYHRLCRTTEPESGSTVMAYDAANNLAWSAQGQAITDGTCGQSDVPTSAQTSRTYDAMNRVLTINPPAGTQATIYTYDALGNIKNTISGIAIQGYSYNTRNLLTNQVLWIPGASYSWSIAYNYDSYAHVNAIGYPSYSGSSEGVAYSPDALGRVTQVGGYASGITYFPNNQVAGFNYGNGASYVAQQNARQLLSNFSYGVGSTLNLSEDFTYDNNGNITNVTDLVNGQRTKAFGYDALNRLTSATATGLYGTENYTYDALNNLRTRLTGGDTLTLNYNGNNQLAGVSQSTGGGTTYGYDTQGNRNSLISGSTTTNYSFDTENQLLQVSGVESYAYDAAGRRIAKTAASGGVTSYYFYDQAGQLMYSFDPGTATATNYIYLGTKLIAKHALQELAVPSVSVSSNPNNGNFTVSWTASAQATSYTLQESINSGSWSTIYSGNATSASVTGRAGGTYAYQVQACTSAGCSSFGSSPSVGVWPAIPTVTVPSGTINGTYTVSWSASSSATGYTVQESFNGGAWATIATNTTSTSLSRPGTTTGSYTYQVEASNSYGTAGWSATSAAVTVNTAFGVVPTPTPTLTVPSTNNTGSQAISWSAASPVTSYTLQQSTNGGTSWTTVYSGTSTSTTLTGLASGSYTYQVQACNASGGGNACTAWSAGGPMAVTLPPTGVPSLSTPSLSGTGSYTVSWSAVSAATSYTLQQQVNGGAWTTIQSSGATSWSASGETYDTYAYRVQACNVGGCAGWSSTGSTVVDLPPGTPSLSGGGTSNNGSYSLSWGAVANATSYTLQESANGGAWTTVQSSGATSWSTSGRGNGTYNYHVQACDQGGCSGLSNQITETVALIPASPSITSVTWTGTDGKAITTINWSAEPNATSYSLRYQQGSTFTTVYTGTATSAMKTFFNSVGDVVEFSAQACNSNGCSAWGTPYTYDIPF